MTPPDLQCTWWPDVWFGVSLTPCCVNHDLSRLGIADSFDLGACVVRRLSATHPLAAVALGAVMALGTAAWCGFKYGIRGKHR